jgi:hypothetical protein
MTLRPAAAAGVRGKRDLGGMEEEKGEISVGVPFVADVFLGISPALAVWYARTHRPRVLPRLARLPCLTVFKN